MTTKELAKVCVKLSEQLGLKEDNKQAFALEVLKECLYGDRPSEEATPKAVEETPRVAPTTLLETPKRPKIKKEKETNKKTQENVYKLLCNTGQKCECSVCGKVLYQVVTDVYDNMPAEEFAGCFAPIGHTKKLSIPLNIRAIDGCVMTDCPVCEGDMTLILWGRKPERDFSDNGVSSVGGLQ